MLIVNFDRLMEARQEAARTGIGSRPWMEFAMTMFDSFPALYDSAKRMNDAMTSPRERQLEEALRNLLAQLELHMDCMSGQIDFNDIEDFVDEAEALLDPLAGEGDRDES